MTPSPDRKPLPLPDGHCKVLLHSCCAPCSGEVMEAMQASGIDYTIFFYNPNIHPLKRNTNFARTRTSASRRSSISLS